MENNVKLGFTEALCASLIVVLSHLILKYTYFHNL
mgnify:CR=1 FL=1